MKRILAISLFLLFVSARSAFACPYDGTCNDQTYDCSQSVGAFDGANKNGCNIYPQCQTSGNCCAEVNQRPVGAGGDQTICFQAKNLPTLGACTAGTSGCPCRTSYPQCDTGLSAQNVSGQCVCSAQTQNPPNPGNFITKCNSGNGLETALGCVPTMDVNSFVAWFLRFAIGIGGGIAFLLMLFGVFQIITSAGSPDKLKAGQEVITSAIIGLIMILFSIFLLQLIGVRILQISSFSF